MWPGTGRAGRPLSQGGFLPGEHSQAALCLGRPAHSRPGKDFEEYRLRALSSDQTGLVFSFPFVNTKISFLIKNAIKIIKAYMVK